MIEKCTCDSEAQLEGFLTRRKDCEWFVRCKNPRCGRLGPITKNQDEAAPRWNAAITAARILGTQVSVNPIFNR